MNHFENQETAEIRIEYSFKNDFGAYLLTETKNDFHLSEPPEGATEFDGYIKTPVGEFAYQGDINGAKKLLDDISALIKLKEELTELNTLRTNLNRDNYAPYKKGENFDEWSKIGGQISELDEKLRATKAKLSAISSRIAKHKL